MKGNEKLNIEYIEINKLKPYKRNNKKHADFDIGEIAKSIEKYGMNDPIGIWKDNMIIEGHGRLEACKKLGIDKVPCIRLDHLTDKQRREYAILHNKTAELAEYDFDNLAAELPDLDFSDFDFDFGIDVDTNKRKEIVENEAPEVDEENEPTVKLGDIWQLGRHRLMCGDSTDKPTVEKLLNGNKADMVFTDPPYDMEMGGQGCFSESMKNCKERTKDIIHFDPYRISYLPELDIHSFYIFTSKNGIIKYLDVFKGLNYDILCWCKTNPVPFTSGSFLPDVEYLLYFSRKGRVWNNSIKPTSIYKKYYVTQKLQGRIDGGGDLHPTMKPIEIVADKCRINAKENGIVLDIFGGSGTTLCVCEQINRICYCIELEPRYCDVIIKRWENLTGEKAVKIN